MSSQRVVIIGGGFGGVTLARKLEKIAGKDTEVVLIASENHFVFTPLLAETAGREILPMHAVVPGREMLRRAQWLTAEVTEIHRPSNAVHYTSRGGERGVLEYSQLVLACGSVADFNTIPGLAAHAYPLRTLGDAVFLSNDLIGRLEEAAVQSDPIEKQRLLTVAVIGGGFSGVELAGALNDMLARTHHLFPQLRGIRPRIVLLQRGDRLVPEFGGPSLSAFALKKLRADGIEVHLNIGAEQVTAREVVLSSGEKISAGTVVCTIGNAPNPILRTLDLPLERGRVRTAPDMRVIDTSNIWALGDCAVVPNAKTGKPSPPTAQFATRQASQLAANIDSAMRGRPTRPFSFQPLGILASIGRHNAVAEVLGVRVSGFAAWLLWRAVYLAKMPTLRRKVEVALDWARSIFFPPSIVQLQLNRTVKVGRAHYAAGEYVFRQGDPGDHFYLIEHGKAGVYLDDNQIAEFLTPGDHFGEVATAGRSGRATSVKAETALDLVLLASGDVRRLTDSLGALRRDIQRSQLTQNSFSRFADIADQEPELRLRQVAGWMTTPAETFHPNMTLEQAVDRFHNGRAGYPVTDSEGRLTGYCGRSQIYDALRAFLPPDTPLSQLHLEDPPAVREDQHAADVLAQLSRTYVEVLPVLAADGSRRVVGVLSPIEIFRERVRTKFHKQGGENEKDNCRIDAAVLG